MNGSLDREQLRDQSEIMQASIVNTRRLPGRPPAILADLGSEGYEIGLDKLCLVIIEVKTVLGDQWPVGPQTRILKNPLARDQDA